MAASNHRPVLIVIAGPNGSGKNFRDLQQIIGYQFVACKVTDNQSP